MCLFAGGKCIVTGIVSAECKCCDLTAYSIVVAVDM